MYIKKIGDYRIQKTHYNASYQQQQAHTGVQGSLGICHAGNSNTETKSS